ncbi:hypothetical protein Y1Q_0008689 [Alligator mississippiensis]|uniref:Uncharacterized protein n=1 Tax=Alligator mississippiensis TaxID=8496 RepID=A0A151N9Q0_ALLMI|nr:hypothetical protein Y1Q_0008689 [Alligator mississippiensis]
MDGQRKRQNKKKQHVLHKAMQKNKTKEMTDEVTNIMMWFVAEKILNALSRVNSLLSSCLTLHRKFWKVTPEYAEGGR